METIENKIEMFYSDWSKKGKLFGDYNPIHYDEFEKFNYKKPSAPSVYLLFLAEKMMKTNNRFSLYPFNLKMNFHYPAYEGKYLLKQYYDSDNISNIQFIHEADGIVASLRFYGKISINIIEDDKKFMSYDFGEIINYFFSNKCRIGAVLKNIDATFSRRPENYPLNINLEVKEEIKNENNRRKIVHYCVKGLGTQKDKEILRVNEGKFVQVIFKG